MSFPIGISLFSAALSLFALLITYNVSVATQRSFVFIKEFQTFVMNDKLVIMPKWQNTGSTPSRGMTNYVNWKADPAGLPDGFTFPDLDETGNFIKTPAASSTFIGPKGEQFASKLQIPLATLEAARLGNTKIYIWGWTSYDDVFWLTSRRRTEFCNQIEVTGIEVDPTTKSVTAGISFAQYKTHNCIDGDCK